MANSIYIIDKNVTPLRVVRFKKVSAYIDYIIDVQNYCRNESKEFIEFKIESSLTKLLKVEHILIEK